ncbi:amino acid adenylation domain-containing protein [Kitasatospora sp. NPDC058162]|uniref:amino acid adenylation domain-containing protein n=1 Tax=Kitasatospora sp. NPDC058162 TaxID=3346362 RepID=UPI0036DBBACA
MPVVVGYAPESTFRELLGTVRQRVADVLAHDSVDDETLWSAAAGCHPVVIGSGADPDAGLTVQLSDGRITVASARLPQSTVDSVARGLTVVLQRGLHDPHQRLLDLPVVDEATASQLLDEFNDTPELVADKPFREQLLAWGEATPTAVAVHDEHEEITYAELVRYATAIAGRLRAGGVGADDIVALCAPRSAWFVVAATGILFSGAAYLPLDPVMPSVRQAHMLRFAKAVVGDVDPAVAPEFVLDFPALRAEARAASTQPTADAVSRLLGASPAPGHLAYVIFTSGSTGTPKGACLEHRNLQNLLAFRASDCELRPGVEIPQTAPVTFDISVWQMFAGLVAGATVCVVPDEVMRDPSALTEMIAAHRYEYVELVPSLISVVLEELDDRPRLADELRSGLRGLISTGEVLGTDLARAWNREMPQVPLINAYGPAECTDDVTQGVVTGEDLDGPYTPVGKPLPNTVIYVLDQDGQLVPPTVPGEICVGGPNVGRGYLDAPELTAAAFVPDPFSGRTGARMYRTGDRGRWRADGVLECFGRRDNQVKIRGRRIELGEIETVLQAHTDVAMGAVELVRQDGLDRLVAFVGAASGTAPGADVLMSHLAERLPDYMVPGEYLVLDALPCNRNGKIDRGRLRELVVERPASAGGHVPPSSETQRVLCELWAKYLKLPRVGITDDFFSLGGDSITIIRLTHEASRRGITLRPKHFYDHRTVESLAALAEQQSSAATVPLGTTAELTGNQKRFFERSFDERQHWNQSYVLDAVRPLRAEVLERALHQVVARHEQLRVKFTEVDGVVRQVVGAVPNGLLWTCAADGGVEAEADRAHASLSLAEGPLLRALLVGDRRVLLTVHRLVIDEDSWPIVIDDLETAYRACEAGEQPEFPARTTAYVRWAAASVDRSPAAPAAAAAPAFDVDGLLVFPPRRAEVANRHGDRVVSELRLDPATTRRMVQRAALQTDEGVPAVLLAGLGRAVAGTRRKGKVLIELESHGRRLPGNTVDVSRTVGWFTAVAPLILPVGPDTDPATVAAELTQARQGSVRCPRTPEAGRIEPEIGFSYLGRAESGRAPQRLFQPGDDLGQCRAPRGHRPLEWEITATVAEESLVIALESAAERHDHADVDETLRLWREYLVGFADEAGTGPALGDIAPLTPTQQAFFARDIPRHDHWNHGVGYTLAEPMTLEGADRLARAMLDRHPVLATGFVATPRGRQQGRRHDAVIPVTELDLTTVTSAPALAERIQAAASQEHRRLDLAHGPISRWLLVHRPAGMPDQLLVIVHHAVIDAYSWDVFTDDLAAALSGTLPRQPEPTTSYGDWARLLHGLVQQQPQQFGLDHWLTPPVSRQVLDGTSTGVMENTVEIHSRFDAERTSRFVQAGADDGLTIYERLLTALAHALSQWLPDADGAVSIELGGHGREDLFDDVDLSRTIGWFNTAYPFALPLPGALSAADHAQQVAGRLRAVPGRGLGFEALKHLSTDTSVREALDQVPTPRLMFDFDGEQAFLDRPEEAAAGPILEITTENTGEWKPDGAPRAHPIDMSVSIRQGRLGIRWRFSGDVVPRERMDSLVEAYVTQLLGGVGE